LATKYWQDAYDEENKTGDREEEFHNLRCHVWLLVSRYAYLQFH